MFRYLRISCEFVAAFAGVLLVLAVIIGWRLNAHPLSSTVLTPYIEAAIAHNIPDTDVHIKHTLLTWDNVAYAINLHADGIEVKDKDGVVIASLPDLDARLNLFGVLFGQFIPRSLVTSHLQLRMERTAEGQLYFGGLTTKSQSKKSNKPSRIRHILHELADAHSLRRLQITDTVAEVYSPDGASLWTIHIPDISLERTNDVLGGHVDINLSQKDKLSTLELHYTYDEDKDLHELATKFENINPSLLAGGHPDVVGIGPASIFNMPLSGEMTAAFDSDLKPAEGSIKIHGDAGTLNVPTFWDQPRAVKSFDAEGSYDGAKDKVDINSVAVDFGGPRLNLSGSGHKPLLSAHDLDFEFKVKLANWPMDQYGQLWPKPIIASAREWIAANMSKGSFDNGEATFKGDLMWQHLADVNITEGQGTISASHAVVKYMDGMPPIEDVSTQATFDLKGMSLQITGGGIGPLRLTPFTIKMTGFDTDMQYIDIPLKISGPIFVLKLIDQPPLQYAKAAGLSPTDITGNAEGLVSLHFPLLKTLAMKDVIIGAKVRLTDVASSKLVKGIDITQGALDLVLDKGGFAVKGPAAFNGATLELAWQENFKAEKNEPAQLATLTGAIKEDQWKTIGTDAFNGTHGDVGVIVQMTQAADKKTSLIGKLDMTAAEVHIDQLNWKKPAGVPAGLNFSAEMQDGKDTVIKSIALTGPQVDVEGSGTLTADGALKSLTVEPMVIGRTDASLYVSEANGALRFEAYGPALDISGLRGGKDPAREKPQPKEYHIKTDRLYTSDTGFIKDAKGYAIRDTDGWSAISLHGMAEGDHKLSIELMTQPNGTRIFSASCDDFGTALRGLGFTDTVRDGDVKITGVSTLANPRMIEGTVRIGHFDVKGLPVLMLLLNATSPLGFTDILSNQTSFDRLKGKFRWQGEQIELIDVNAAGTSVGLNIDGKVDMDSGDAKLHGTIVPFSMFNRILGAIPVLGDIITGGNGGGVLAVAYNIDGTLADPQISVNPVSLLTPGFLRNIFFGPDDDEDTPDSAAQVNAPQTGAVPEGK